MAEYTSTIIDFPLSCTDDVWVTDPLSGREITPVEKFLTNFGPVVQPYIDATVIPSIYNALRDGFMPEQPTGREFTNRIIAYGYLPHYAYRTDALSGREQAIYVRLFKRGYPESTFGRRTSGYVVDPNGSVLSFDGEVSMFIVGDTGSGLDDKITKVGLEGFYEFFLKGGYDKWYIVAKKGSKYLLYEKDPDAPPIEKGNIPDFLDLRFVKVRLGYNYIGRYLGGIT